MNNFLKILIGIFAILFLLGCTSPTTNPSGELTTKVATLSDKDLSTLKSEIRTFNELDVDICTTDEGKPIIRLFSTTWCPHCQWVKSTFDNTVQEYVNAGLIEAYHWEVDTYDNALTQGIEGTIPQSEVSVFRNYNPEGSIPTFVMGCKYYRVGNGFESQNNLAAEEAEFRSVIEALIKEASSN